MSMESQLNRKTAPARTEDGTVKAGAGGRHWRALALVAGVALALFVGSRVNTEQAAAVHPDHGIVCTDGTEFFLRATDGYISEPDGNSLYMWSYANDEGGVGTGAFQFPGPTLCVLEGAIITVHLANDLPEPVSILFLGQEGVEADNPADLDPFGLAQPQYDTGLTSLTNVAPPGGDVIYRFTASAPGTYIYESGTEPDKQVQMGLVGALIVRPNVSDVPGGIAGHTYAYDDVDTEYSPDREFLLLFHEVDPYLHRAVELGQPYNVTELEFHYWTINGRSLPDTIAPNDAPWLPGQPYGALVVLEPYNDDVGDPNYNPLPALVRIANPGMANHPFHPHANSLRVIAQDGRQLKGPAGEDLSYEKFGRTTGSGQTFDSLFRWTDVEGWDPNFNPVPVQIPGLQNLVFMGDSTFYSGSPYLGYQGELPVGVTSYNQCGEQYFPWHSHALNEFQNFDEGFGGLGTLLRVDPPGGCP